MQVHIIVFTKHFTKIEVDNKNGWEQKSNKPESNLED